MMAASLKKAESFTDKSKIFTGSYTKSKYTNQLSFNDKDYEKQKEDCTFSPKIQK